MALKKQSSNGRHLYAKVSRLEFKKDNASCVDVFLELRDDQTLDVIQADSFRFYPLDSEQYHFLLSAQLPDGENPIKSAYLYLKAHKAMFEGWEDC